MKVKMRVKITSINVIIASLAAINAAIVSTSEYIPITNDSIPSPKIISTKTISTKTIATKTIPTITQNITTLTYKSRDYTITHSMSPPTSIKSLKLVCSTSEPQSEYCTEIFDTKIQKIVYECYNKYETIENTQEPSVGNCAIYAIPNGPIDYKTKYYCDSYYHVQNGQVQPTTLCRERLARYIYATTKTISTTPTLISTKTTTTLDPNTLVPLESGFKYTIAPLNGRNIEFPVPKQVNDVTINCQTPPEQDEYYSTFRNVFGYEYVQPTSVPFSIINQDYITEDNPEFTATTVDRTDTGDNNITKDPYEAPFKTEDSVPTGLNVPSKSIPGKTLPGKNISNREAISGTKTVPLRTEPENIYMGSLITYSNGEITTKMPIVAASLIYCDEEQTELCYGAYAVTDTCTIYTRTSTSAKTVPPELITETTSPISTPTVTNTQCPKCLENTMSCKMATVTVTENACPDCPEYPINNMPCKTLYSTVVKTQTTKVTITEKDTVTVTVTVNDNLAVKCKRKYEQCGGINYQGITCCESGLECQKVDDYFYQCS